MLITSWITERLAKGHTAFEPLSADIVTRAADRGLTATSSEVRVILEKLIRDGTVESCQYLAEDSCYEPTIYDSSNIYFYTFRLKGQTQHHTPMRGEIDGHK
jgi:hypothetical protein